MLRAASSVVLILHAGKKRRAHLSSRSGLTERPAVCRNSGITVAGHLQPGRNLLKSLPCVRSGLAVLDDWDLDGYSCYHWCYHHHHYYRRFLLRSSRLCML